MSQDPSFHTLNHETAPLLQDAEVFDNAIDPAQCAAFVADPGHVMVFATLDGEVVGIASGTVLLHPDKQPAFFVNEVGVAEALRCKGLGAALTERLLDQARALGCQGIWLATEGDNAPARALYRKIGARETEDIVVYDWDGAMDD